MCAQLRCRGFFNIAPACDDDDVGFFRQIKPPCTGMLAPSADDVFAVIGTDFRVKERIVPIGRLKTEKGMLKTKSFMPD